MSREKQNKGAKQGKEDSAKREVNLLLHETITEAVDGSDIDAIVRQAVRSELISFKADMEKWFSEKLAAVEKRVCSLEIDIGRQAKESVDLQRENTHLRQQIVEHAQRLEELESFTKSDNLIIRGLPESPAAERAHIHLCLLGT